MILNFMIPRGDVGPEGKRGKSGQPGEAATIAIGGVATGAAGSDATVTNTGTAQNAVLHFTIPQGTPAPVLAPNALTATNAAPQMTAEEQAITFSNNLTQVGDAITHEAGSAEINITQTGIYSIAFHCTSRLSGPSAAVTRTLSILENETPVAGASTQHSFVLGAESTTMFFSTILEVTSSPVIWKVVSDGDEVSISNASFSVYRLADAPQTEPDAP